MMTQIKNIQGFEENFPKKIEDLYFDESLYERVPLDSEDSEDSCVNKGFNEAIDQISSLSIVIDEEELAKMLFEMRQKELYGNEFLTWEEAVELQAKRIGSTTFLEIEYMEKARTITKNADKFLRIERTK